MKGIETFAIDALYDQNAQMGDKFDFYISFFEYMVEIYMIY